MEAIVRKSIAQRIIPSPNALIGAQIELCPMSPTGPGQNAKGILGDLENRLNCCRVALELLEPSSDARRGMN